MSFIHSSSSGSSSSGGIGSLPDLNALANTSVNGGFYTELPDAIYCEVTSDGYAGVFRLHWVKPNSDISSDVWEVVYRVEAWQSSGDFSIHFKLDADGTNLAANNGATATNANTKNLRWFIENDRAIYGGGSSSSSASVRLRRSRCRGAGTPTPRRNLPP